MSLITPPTAGGRIPPHTPHSPSATRRDRRRRRRPPPRSHIVVSLLPSSSNILSVASTGVNTLPLSVPHRPYSTHLPATVVHSTGSARWRPRSRRSGYVHIGGKEPACAPPECGATRGEPCYTDFWDMSADNLQLQKVAKPQLTQQGTANWCYRSTSRCRRAHPHSSGPCPRRRTFLTVGYLFLLSDTTDNDRALYHCEGTQLDASTAELH